MGEPVTLGSFATLSATRLCGRVAARMEENGCEQRTFPYGQFSGQNTVGEEKS